ncbi:MAG TPA: hypothetical protein VLH38_03120 [Patescibacteria group bacterium]|nr:hypothetical protein [Patescibacteria group bacterium]
MKKEIFQKLAAKLSKVKAKKPLLYKAVFGIAVSLIIVLVLLPVLISYKHIGWLDWDTYVSYYESIRRVIIDYHQFPWWDPWIAGGVPLYGNPQIGVISLETPLVLLFGTIFGLKLAAAIYFISGFWGMYWLLKELKTQLAPRLLLSYIWIFSTFVTFHFYAGHITFLLYLLSPWLFFLALRLRDGWWWAVGLGLFIGFLGNASIHYMVIHSLIILGAWMTVEFVTSKDKKIFILRSLVAWAIGLVMWLPHLYFAYTYVSDFPAQASALLQPVSDWRTTARAFLLPLQRPDNPLRNGLRWWEYSSYSGVTTVILFFAVTINYFRDFYKHKKMNLGLIFFIGFLICFTLGLGPFAKFSPYNILQHMPVLKSTEVPSRWFGWCLFFALLTISQCKKPTKLLTALLVIAAIELTVTLPLGRIFRHTPPARIANSNFQQHYDFPVPDPYTSNMYQGIISNYGVIPAYEPIIFRSGLPLARCGIEDGCGLASDNARVLYWSPNIIRLQRAAAGTITVNINPGSYWLVNGKRLFANDRVAEPGKQFLITDPSKNIVLEIKPQL